VTPALRALHRQLAEEGLVKDHPSFHEEEPVNALNSDDMPEHDRQILAAALAYLGKLALSDRRGAETPENCATEIGRQHPHLKAGYSANGWTRKVRSLLEQAGLSSGGGMASKGALDDRGIKRDSTLTNNTRKQPGSSFSMSDAEWADLKAQYRLADPRGYAEVFGSLAPAAQGGGAALSHSAPKSRAEARAEYLADSLLAGRPIPSGNRPGPAETLNKFGTWDAAPGAVALAVESTFADHLSEDRAEALANQLLNAVPVRSPGRAPA
jgi:hypothetical protein